MDGVTAKSLHCMLGCIFSVLQCIEGNVPGVLDSKDPDNDM